MVEVGDISNIGDELYPCRPAKSKKFLNLHFHGEKNPKKSVGIKIATKCGKSVSCD